MAAVTQAPDLTTISSVALAVSTKLSTELEPELEVRCLPSVRRRPTGSSAYRVCDQDGRFPCLARRAGRLVEALARRRSFLDAGAAGAAGLPRLSRKIGHRDHLVIACFPGLVRVLAGSTYAQAAILPDAVPALSHVSRLDSQPIVLLWVYSPTYAKSVMQAHDFRLLRFCAMPWFHRLVHRMSGRSRRMTSWP